MFKKSLRIFSFLVISSLFIPAAFAASGACSGHGGVDCSAGQDSDGSVICYDGWENSSVQYSSMVMCMGSVTPSTTPAPQPAPLPTPVQTSTTTEDFSDISTSPYKDAIEFVKSAGIVNGYDDSTYRPNNKINRAEFTKILVEAAFANEVSTYTPSACFKDVSATAWYAKYICLAKDKGVISGYNDGTFAPNKNINVPESLKITLEAFPNVIPETSGSWYQKYLDYATTKGYLLPEWNDTNLEISRGQMAEFIYRIKK
jgi:hypothetical protein